jgi:hypothetical protein
VVVNLGGKIQPLFFSLFIIIIIFIKGLSTDIFIVILIIDVETAAWITSRWSRDRI